MLTVESNIIIMFWARNCIFFLKTSLIGVGSLDPHPTTYYPNISAQIIVVFDLGNTLHLDEDTLYNNSPLDHQCGNNKWHVFMPFLILQ
jgi:hypothetical protein